MRVSVCERGAGGERGREMDLYAVYIFAESADIDIPVGY